jgi:predicted nucleic acid-binding protein
MKNMPAKPVILVDLNILLDVFYKREPFYELSARVLGLIESGKVIGFVASHSLPTLFYIIKKDQTVKNAKAVVSDLLQIFKVASVDQSTIEQALILDYNDFEDAVQMSSALHCKADYLITRNIKDFQPPLIPVMQPVEFLAIFSSSK